LAAGLCTIPVMRDQMLLFGAKWSTATLTQRLHMEGLWI